MANGEEQARIREKLKSSLDDIERVVDQSDVEVKRGYIATMWEKLAAEGIAPTDPDRLICENFVRGIVSLAELSIYIEKRRANT